MNKEFLVNYKEKELQHTNDSIKDFLEGKIDNIKDIISYDRFKKINQPVAFSDGSENNHYSIIPFYGTTIIPIFPTYKKFFFQSHGFNISDIENIVSYAKDTGKIQFVLGSDPIHFEDLDYFDPIFNELEPPLFTRFNPPDIVPKKEYFEYLHEFDILYSIRVHDEMINLMSKKYTYEMMPLLYGSIASIYIMTKYMGYEEVINLLQGLFLEQNMHIMKIIELLDIFIVAPKLYILNAVPNYGIQRIKHILTHTQDILKTDYVKDIKIPFEIGSFLINKLTYNPGNFEACKDVVDYYEQTDLTNVFNNLYNAVKIKNIDILSKNQNELNTILDNIWKEVNLIKISSNQIKFLIPVSIAIIGSLVSHFDLKTGILTSLGLTLAKKYLDYKAESLSKKVAKLGYENYLIGMFDFKQKYPRLK